MKKMPTGLSHKFLTLYCTAQKRWESDKLLFNVFKHAQTIQDVASLSNILKNLNYDLSTDILDWITLIRSFLGDIYKFLQTHNVTYEENSKYLGMKSELLSLYASLDSKELYNLSISAAEECRNQFREVLCALKDEVLPIIEVSSAGLKK